MRVPKFLLPTPKKLDFRPKIGQIWPKTGIFGQFGPGHAGLFSALLVGRLVVVARGLYLARHLFTLSLCASTTVEGILKKLSKRNNFTVHRSTNYWRFLSNSLSSWLYPYHPATHKSIIVLRIWVFKSFNCHIKILRTVYLFQPGVVAQRGGAACEELGQDGERGTDHL